MTAKSNELEQAISSTQASNQNQDASNDSITRKSIEESSDIIGELQSNYQKLLSRSDAAFALCNEQKEASARLQFKIDELEAEMTEKLNLPKIEMQSCQDSDSIKTINGSHSESGKLWFNQEQLRMNHEMIETMNEELAEAMEALEQLRVNQEYQADLVLNNKK